MVITKRHLHFWAPALLVAAACWPATIAAQSDEPPADPSGSAAAPPMEDAPMGESAAASDSGGESAPPVLLEDSPAAAVEGGASDTGAADEGEGDAAGWGDWGADQVEETVFEGKIYGFIDAYFEKVANTPARDPNDPTQTIYETNPYEFDVLNANIMIQGSIFGRHRFFLNLAAPGSGSMGVDKTIAVRNAWVETPLLPGYLSVRAGKTYRRFGLYNEILDAVPTFIGIEPPELFDPDHLMLTRTTNLMLFGSAAFGSVVLNYAATTGNDERASGAFPVGLDVYLEYNSWLRLGTSFYTTGGDAQPTFGVGEGPPRGGVADWMERDEFVVFGGYVQVQHDSGLILQAEYWQAQHDGTRDAGSLQLLAASGTLNPAQLARFFVDGDPDAGERLDASYTVRTAYARLGYELALGEHASLTPYLQVDYYSNPETVAAKSLGGDNEAGLSDDGAFQKYTVGSVIRPVPQVALKVDGSAHVQEFNGKTEWYPELRLSFSFLWGLQ